MRFRKRVSWVLLASLAWFSSGCSGEEGLREGVINGLDEAITALITVPVQYFLDQRFGAE